MKIAAGIVLSGIFIFCMGMFTKTFSETNGGDVGVISLGGSVATIGVVITIIGVIIALITIKNKK